MTQETLEAWTIGHSTRTGGEFLALLKMCRIQLVADVRQFPGSRSYPQFGREALASFLAQSGIEYCHFPELGGRRPARPDSLNRAWRNASFRGYADYMATDPFRAGIDRLLSAARKQQTAIMCAEAVWWRCHRSLIADYLKAQGVKVYHILGPEKVQEHPYTSAASIIDGKLSYEAEPSLQRRE